MCLAKLATAGWATDEHPTTAGMRIGKPDAEDTSDGDGHFSYYLTK